LTGGRIDYEERLNRVTAYVDDHLDEDVDLQTLADVARLSPYHWHRIYHACRGETIAATVTRLRLERAAADLAQTSMTTAEIAQRSGYRTVSSFTAAFLRAFGLPPARYRVRGSHVLHLRSPVRTRATTMDANHAVAIVTLKKARAVTIEHRGSYLNIERTFDALYGWLGMRGLIRPDMRPIGLFYDDPTAVPESDLEARAGVILPEPLDIEPPLERIDIPGRDYAVLTHTGPYANMKSAYRWLFGEWLPAAGQELANEPLLEEYLNSPRDTPPAELVTKLCLPLL